MPVTACAAWMTSAGGVESLVSSAPEVADKLAACTRRWGPKRVGLVAATHGGRGTESGRSRPDEVLESLVQDFQIRGPCVAVVGHLDAGAKALAIALRRIRHGVIDAAIVVGVAGRRPDVGTATVLLERQADAEVELRGLSVQRGPSAMRDALARASSGAGIVVGRIDWAHVDGDDGWAKVLPSAVIRVGTQGDEERWGPATFIYRLARVTTALELGVLPTPESGRASPTSDAETALVALASSDVVAVGIAGVRSP